MLSTTEKVLRQNKALTVMDLIMQTIMSNYCIKVISVTTIVTQLFGLEAMLNLIAIIN